MSELQFLFFTKGDCPNCEAAEKTAAFLREQGYDVVKVNTDDTDGLVEISLRGITSVPAITLEEAGETDNDPIELHNMILESWVWGAKGLPPAEAIAKAAEKHVRGK